MWRSRMFWRLFGAYSVLLAVSLGLLGFHGACVCQGLLAGDCNESVQFAVVAFNASQARSGQIDRRNGFAAEQLSRLLKRHPGQILRFRDRRFEHQANGRGNGGGEKTPSGWKLRHGSGPRPMLHSRMAAYLSIMTDLPTTIQLRSVAISRQWLAFPQLSVSGQSTFPE